MDKRYQVFVSSTYADLKEERRAVMQALMEMDCIPAGMELFPAMDEEQLAFIRKIIDDCDYYLLIIGGRYGSLSPDGVSYTEKEYDYAIETGRKVIALVHDNPGELTVSKSDTDPQLVKGLNQFRDKVKSGRMVKMWKNSHELPGLVALSVQKSIKAFRAVGWVRGDVVASSQAIQEVNGLRNKIDELRAKIKTLKEENANLKNELAAPAEGLAGLDETFTLHFQVYAGSRRVSAECKATWGEIFAAIAPHLLHPKTDNEVTEVIEGLAEKKSRYGTAYLDNQVLQTIKVQLPALGLVKVEYTHTTNGNMGLFWYLTPRGNRTMIELRAIPSGKGL